MNHIHDIHSPEHSHAFGQDRKRSGESRTLILISRAVMVARCPTTVVEKEI